MAADAGDKFVQEHPYFASATMALGGAPTMQEATGVTQQQAQEQYKSNREGTMTAVLSPMATVPFAGTAAGLGALLRAYPWIAKGLGIGASIAAGQQIPFGDITHAVLGKLIQKLEP